MDLANTHRSLGGTTVQFKKLSQKAGKDDTYSAQRMETVGKQAQKRPVRAYRQDATKHRP